MQKVSIVVGNPKPKSRTLKISEALVAALFDSKNVELRIIDLADHMDQIFSWPSAEMDSINKTVAESDLAVFASPTYKATYTGLLKAFLDRYPANGLSGVTAIPLLTGGSAKHYMGSTVNLAPLLIELGAAVPGRGLYFEVQNMDRIEEITQEFALTYQKNISRIAALAKDLRV